MKNEDEFKKHIKEEPLKRECIRRMLKIRDVYFENRNSSFNSKNNKLSYRNKNYVKKDWRYWRGRSIYEINEEAIRYLKLIAKIKRP
jgi:hypothetical protein